MTWTIFFRSSFSDFAQKYAKDERFKGVEKMRERESLFNEYLIEVRKKEKEEKIQRRETVSKNYLLMLDLWCIWKKGLMPIKVFQVVEYF